MQKDICVLLSRSVHKYDKSKMSVNRIGLVISFDHLQERITRPGKPAVLKNKRDTPRITIEDIKVTYVPSAEPSVERLYEEQLGARVLSDTLLQYIEQKAKENL